MTLIHPGNGTTGRKRWFIVSLVVFGSALHYGDGTRVDRPARRADLCYGKQLRSMCKGVDPEQSMDIMTLSMNMLRIEKTNSFLAQSRSSDVL